MNITFIFSRHLYFNSPSQMIADGIAYLMSVHSDSLRVNSCSNSMSPIRIASSARNTMIAAAE